MATSLLPSADVCLFILKQDSESAPPKQYYYVHSKMDAEGHLQNKYLFSVSLRIVCQ